MKSLIVCLILCLNVTWAHGQTLRIVGYEAELVFVDTRIEPITVRGATLSACEDNFNAARAGRDLYYGKRYGTQECVPLFVYRSPTAPGFALSPAVTLMPQIPWPPRCLSCPVFEDAELVKRLYPDHSQLVNKYVKQYKIDEYNLALKALNRQYSQWIEGFEQKMMALDDYLEEKNQ